MLGKRVFWGFFHALRGKFQSIKQRSSAMAAQKTVSVRAVPGEERLQISLSYALSNTRTRVFNMDRLQNEELGKALTRLSSNITSRTKRKKKKKNNNADGAVGGIEEKIEEEIPVSLFHKGTKVEDTIPNLDAWVEGALLHVGETQYQICVNPPSINSMTLPSCIMAGFPVQPKLDAEFIDLDKCCFVWYRRKTKDSEHDEIYPNADPSSCNHGNTANIQSVDVGNQERTMDSVSMVEQPLLSKSSERKRSSNSRGDEDHWEEVHRGYWYMASNSDIGHKLKLICVPANIHQQGEGKEAISTCDVSAGPGLCPFENRHLLTESRTPPGSFRVVSYNILADLYADSDFSRTQLFPYCPPYALAADYRKLLIIKELLGYNADIICLQEVDRRLFQNELLAAFDQQNMGGMLKLKAGEVAEGTAILYHRDKFRLIGQHDVVLTDAVMSQDIFIDLKEKICNQEGLKVKMLERSSILQVTVLESKEVPESCIVVATTHLYFHPMANHIRLLQTEICLRHLRQVMSLYEKEGLKPSLVFSGDFNSGPHTAVYQLLTANQVPADHSDWRIGGEEELIEGLPLNHSLSLISACGTPEYTNFTSGFHGCLDYIFIDQTQLEVKEVIPLPSHEEVTQQVAIPNMVFPSDHLALVCDLTFTPVKSD